MNSPSPDQVKAARIAAGLSQKACAERMGYELRGWQKKEESGASARSLSAGEYELLLLLAEEHPDYLLTPR